MIMWTGEGGEKFNCDSLSSCHVGRQRSMCVFTPMYFIFKARLSVLRVADWVSKLTTILNSKILIEIEKVTQCTVIAVLKTSIL